VKISYSLVTDDHGNVRENLVVAERLVAVNDRDSVTKVGVTRGETNGVTLFFLKN